MLASRRARGTDSRDPLYSARGDATYIADVDIGKRLHGPYPGDIGHHAWAVRGDPGADTLLCRPAGDGSAVVTRRGPVNLRHLEGSVGFCCAHGPRKPFRTLVNTPSGQFSGRIIGGSSQMGLIAWQEGAILVSEEPGSGAGQATWEMSDNLEKVMAGLDHDGADEGIQMDFVRCCRGERQPRTGWRDGMASIAVSLAVRQSCDTGQPIELADDLFAGI